MKDESKTKDQLIAELAELRKRLAESEAEASDENAALRRDIDELRKAESALRKSEKMFRRLAQNAPDIIYRYELAPRRRFTYISPAVKFIAGHAPEQYYADPDLIFRLVHPEDRPLLESVFLQDATGEIRPALCFPALRWVRDDGTVVWTEEHTTPIYDDEGKVTAIEGVARDITQRRMMEEALTRAHQQLLGIVESLPDATFVIDRHRKVIAWNRAIEEMTGVLKRDILGRSGYAHSVPFYGETKPVLVDLVFGDDSSAAGQYNFIKRKGDTLYAQAYVPMTYGGKGAYLWVTASPLYDDRGTLLGAIESIRDITDRMRAEEDLQAAHLRLMGIIDFLPDATFVIDKDRKVIAWNRAIEEMTGTAKADILGMGDYAYGIPFYGDPRPILIDLVFGGAGHLSDQYDFVERKGETFFAESFVPMVYSGRGAYLWITASPLYDRNGELIGAIESIRDITDRKRAEQALQREKEYVGFIVAAAPNLICGIAPNGITVSANAMVSTITGYAPDEIIGANWWRLMYPGEEYAQVDRLFEELRKGPVVNYEMTLTAKTGEKRVVSWNTTNRTGARGELTELIKIGADITEKKKMGETLRINAEKIKLFAYSVSHDLKSPIIGINGLTNLLHKQCRDLLNAKGRIYCDQILKASEQVMALIEEINVYIRTREIPLTFQTVNPKEILGMVRGEFDALLSVRRVKWVEPETMPEFRADRLSLLRVFRNLVDNALKYGGGNMTEIRIGYGDTDDYHILSVSDDGVGVKPADTEKIFGLFQRNETSKGVEGTGLGLAIVKEIAEKHRGKVVAEAGSKHGAVFHVYVSKNL